MTQNWLAKALLSPFAGLYGLVVGARNVMYDAEIVKSSRFSIPVISVGNLSIGGAGKTPHIEYLIDLLNPYINVATLSRGYGRSTSGFRFVSQQDTASTVGDEPLLYARKHKGIVAAVAENRALAIPQIVGSYPDTQAVLLDDAYQHRSVKPYINILLTQHDHLFTRDHLLPAGRLREWRSSYRRADIIVVTKCPDILTEAERKSIVNEIKPMAHQLVLFSRYGYQDPYSFYYPDQTLKLQPSIDGIVISAIANTDYLRQYLDKVMDSYHPMEYTDHHVFSDQDISYITKVYSKREKQNKFVLTTEKDAMRLLPFRKQLYDAKIPVYVLPLNVVFMDDDAAIFDQWIKNKLLQFES